VIAGRRLRRCCSVLLALVCGLAAAGAPEPHDGIVWAAIDFPPFQILGGEFRGSGSFDGLRELLVSRLPGYRHEIMAMTFARREEELRQGQLLCTPGMFRTPEREQLLVFSRPALIHLDNRVVFLASRADRFGGGELDLAGLLMQPDLVGGVISGRSFAPNIDALLKRYGGQPNLVMRPVRAAQMLEMLASGEIDYTILFPHEAAYLRRQLGLKDALVLRPIAGTPPYIFTHVACSRSAWGESVIARVDRVLEELRATPAYRAYSERWYDQADQLLIRRHYPRLLEAPAGSGAP
jgi:uncharacterized protein (TIGR02285 family)